MENQITELVDHSDIFTKEDIEEINGGIDARVWISVDEMDMSLVPEEEKVEVLEIAKGLGSEDAGFIFFDISLLKQVGSGDVSSIHEPGIDIEVSIEVPEAIRNTNPNVERKYSVLRIHDEKVENLGGDYDEETARIVFRTKKFSTYVLAYADTPIGKAEVISDTYVSDAEISNTDSSDTVAEPERNTPIPVVLGLLLLAGAGLITFLAIRRKHREEE